MGFLAFDRGTEAILQMGNPEWIRPEADPETNLRCTELVWEVIPGNTAREVTRGVCSYTSYTVVTLPPHHF